MVMIELNEDLFRLNVDALAHGCNTLGIMNAGIAKRFKEEYPDMFREYLSYCRSGLFSPGNVHFYNGLKKDKPRVVNIATQLDLEGGAQLDYIEQGFTQVRENYRRWGIKSLGMPKIGCGLGGLDWKDVSEIVEKIFGTADLEILISTRTG